MLNYKIMWMILKIVNVVLQDNVINNTVSKQNGF